MADRGHLFVVRGKLESVYCDAVIIPTGHYLQPHDRWGALVPDARESGTSGEGFATLRPVGSEHPTVWLLDVTNHGEPDLDAMVKHLTLALSNIAAEAPKLSTTRPCPLVAVPAVGVGEGGQYGAAGRTIRRVMQALEGGAVGFDIALVLRNESDYAAAQWIRRQGAKCDKDGTVHQAQSKIADLARKGGLSLLIGAGVSMGAGLPSWNELLESLMPDDGTMEVDRKSFFDLGALDQAEFLKKVRGNQIRPAIVEQVQAVTRPALGHFLLASLGCRAVATTNYDTLYEDAVASQEGTPVPTVLPYRGPAQGEPWLLKLHGDVGHPEDIVLARSEFVAYDSNNAPAGAIFQSMLLTTHMLAVGVSFADDNVLRLTHEVAEFLRPHDDAGTRELGTVLALGGNEFQEAIWEGTLDWLAIGTPGADVRALARELEIFLDHVAMHASTSSSYLLDERYAALTADDVHTVNAARAAADRVPSKPAAHDRWKPLRDAFVASGYKRR